MALKTAAQLMADVVEMYSGQGAYEELYQSNKARFMADTLARLGPALTSTTRPAAISAGYEREVGPQFAAQKIGMKATAMTNLASLLEQHDQFTKQLAQSKYLTKLGISSQEQQTKWGIESQEKLQADLNSLNLKLAQMGITSTEKLEAARIKAGLQSTSMGIAGGLQSTGMQVASQQGINAAQIASAERIAGLGAQTSLQIAGMQYPALPNVSGYQTVFRSVTQPGYTPSGAQKITQPTAPVTFPINPSGLTTMSQLFNVPSDKWQW